MVHQSNLSALKTIHKPEKKNCLKRVKEWSFNKCGARLCMTAVVMSARLQSVFHEPSLPDCLVAGQFVSVKHNAEQKVLLLPVGYSIHKNFRVPEYVMSDPLPHSSYTV